MLFYVITALYVIVCFGLMLVILLQQGKGGDMASAFGGGGGTQAAFGARSGATVLSRATTVFAVLFLLGAMAIGIMGQHGGGGGSVVSGRANPVAQPSTPPQPTPATPSQANPKK
jgi:preprotein translocase subunit SecG